MSNFSLSQLQYPFPDLVNPQVKAMEAFGRELIEKYTDLNSTLQQGIKKSSVGQLIARFYPLAGSEYVFTIVRYLVYAFAVEDTYTRLPYAELAAKCERIAKLHKDGIVLPGDETIIKQLKLCIDEAVALHATPFWLERFARHNNEFLQALLNETTFYKDKEAIHFPSFQEGLNYREGQIAFFPFLDYLELTTGFIMTEDIYIHPAMQQLHKLSAHFIIFVNDLYSVEKDLYNKEIMNVVLLIQQQEHCSLEEAQIMTLQHHNANLEIFLQCCASLPHVGIHRSSVSVYVKHLQLLIQGNLSWHKICKRYTEYSG